jgi:hypothetical protein
MVSRFGNRRHDGQMISGVQRDRLGDHPQVTIKVVKPGVHIVKPLAQ